MTILSLLELFFGLIMLVWSIDGIRKGLQTLKGDIYAWRRWFPYNIIYSVYHRVSQINPERFTEKYISIDPKWIRAVGYCIVISGSTSAIASIMYILFLMSAFFQ